MDLERRKRNRLTVALALGATFFMLIAALAVWINYLQAEERAATRRGELAEEALNERLNKHLRGQSRRISKGCESTLLIMRHCEKVGPLVSDDDGNEHCSLIGFERARYIATLFGDAPEERWPAPAHLFALSPVRGDHWNFREWETLFPLSKKIDTQIDVTESLLDLGSAPHNRKKRS